MGCCQSEYQDTELVISQANTLCDPDQSSKFREVPLSSSPSPLKFALFQEELISTVRTSYDTVASSNSHHSRNSLELAFVCSKL